jgi:hypothetical protein
MRGLNPQKRKGKIIFTFIKNEKDAIRIFFINPLFIENDFMPV